jgi:predicted ester cyclase
MDFQGIEAYKKYILGYRKAFPDINFTINGQIAEDDRVVDWFTASGTHKGDFMGIAPSGKHFEVMGIGISRIENNKMVEIRGAFDALGLMRQIGAVTI